MYQGYMLEPQNESDTRRNSDSSDPDSLKARGRPRAKSFREGSNVDLKKDIDEMKDFLVSHGIEWKDDYTRFCGTTARIEPGSKDSGIVKLRMCDDTVLKFKGISQLVHIDTDWTEQKLESHEKEIAKELEKLANENPSPSTTTESVLSGGSVEHKDAILLSGGSVEHKDAILISGGSMENKDAILWKRGDKVLVNFGTAYSPKTHQGTVWDVHPDRELIYDVKIDELGQIYQIGSHEIEECPSPQEWKEDSELQRFLCNLNLQMHHNSLMDEGFETLDDLENVQFEDLLAVGMKRGHARRLEKALEEYNLMPELSFADLNYRLQERPSMRQHRKSLMMAASALSTQQLPHLQLQNYDSPFKIHDRYQIQPPVDLTDSKWGDGFLVISFLRRPLGFGIMSPLLKGCMLSTITDNRLKNKGLVLGLPLLHINKKNVSELSLNNVVSILEEIELPFTITFGLQPYFKPGQRVIVQSTSKNEWLPATVLKMSSSSNKVTVKYDKSKFFKRTEKIKNYNRIKLPDLILDE